MVLAYVCVCEISFIIIVANVKHCQVVKILWELQNGCPSALLCGILSMTKKFRIIAMVTKLANKNLIVKRTPVNFLP